MKTNSTASGKQDFHITVGIQPTNDLNLDKEIQMLKAAILYADKVKLYSLKIPSILAISRFEKFPLNSRLDFFERILPYLSSSDKAQKLSSSLGDYRKILGKKNPNDHELQFKGEFEKVLQRSWDGIADTTSKFVKASQIDQINSAIKAGILEVHESNPSVEDDAALNLLFENALTASAKKSKEGPSKKSQDNARIQEFVEDISDSVSNASTYPLLDSETGNLFNTCAGSKAMQIAGFEMERGKQTELARYLLERLPLFEEASVDEILDIRKELDKPLTRFRSAIIDFSDQIKSAPWNQSFPFEAEKIYLRDVKPAMLEIEEALQSNKLLASMFKRFKEKSMVELPKGSLISMGIAQLSSLSKELAASLGIGIASASIFYDAYEEWLKKKQAAEQNKLYFYYGVQEKLKKQSRM
ncbi:MAG: hypothetical protein JNM55_12420 [Anaerolineales bacterium]|nr:hypothetical protein [Anaerolineales bacterium]